MFPVNHRRGNMGVSAFNKVNLRFLALFYGCVTAQEYFEELHKAHYSTHLKKIPKHFEIRGDHAKDQLETRLNEIQHLAKRDNLTLIYKVNVETLKPYQAIMKKMLLKKGKSKKYNVPLKKNSMKLSNFEMYLRKMAEESGHNVQKVDFNPALTTERQRLGTTKLLQMKYKPIISRVKTNYTKIVRPVRNREIVLTM